jgi:hypothetical protein
MSEISVEMRAVVEEWKRSGMSISSFSREKCISYYKMLYWRDKFAGREKKKKAGSFRHLSVKEENSSSKINILLLYKAMKKVLINSLISLNNGIILLLHTE